MLALFPLTAKQAKSMLSMQRAQPKIKELQAKYNNMIEAIPYFFMVALVIGTGILQQKQTQRQQIGAPNPQMMMVAKVMPLFFGLIALSLPAGLVLYFFVSNVWRVGQQELIMRK